MKAIQVVPYIGNEASGPAYSVVELCLALSCCNVDIALMTLTGKNCRNLNSINHFLCRRCSFFYEFGFSYEMLKFLLIFLQSSDILHNHSLWMMPNIYSIFVSKLSSKPVIVSPRGTLSSIAFHSGSFTKKIIWPLMQYPVLQKVDCFHATSFKEFEDIRSFGFKQPVSIIHNGIHIPKISKKQATFPVRTLLFLGRIHPIKGLELLLQAWKILQDKYIDWCLKIVGIGSLEYTKKIKDMAQSLCLKRVEFAGPRYGSEKWEVYRNSDLYILPSHSENFGVSVAEALAIGLPAIVTQGAPWSGLVDEQCGWWPEVNVPSIIDALNEALSQSPDRLSEMGSKGREWMRRDYSWAAIGSQMEDTYKWILYGGPKPACVMD